MENDITCVNCTIGCSDIFNQENLDLLDQNKSTLTFNQGDILIKQEGLASSILSIRKGLVKIVLEGRNNNNTILKIVNENNLIALPILGDISKYPFSVVALTNVEVCEIRKEKMIEIMEKNPRINKLITNKFASDLLYMGQRISVLSTRNNHGKLASALYYLYVNFNNTGIFNNITRKELAELSSISLESVNKILLQLKNDKIITLDNKGLTILLPDLVKRLSLIG